MAAPNVKIIVPFGDRDKLLQPRDKEDVRTYDIDWGPFLQLDTIASQTTTVKNQTLDSSSFSSNIVTVTISAGNAGTSATFTNQIVTAGGSTFQRSFKMEIENL